MIDRGSKLEVCETKGVLHAATLCGWDCRFSPWDSSLLPLRGVWSGPFSPWSDVHYSVLAASSVLCCVSLQILILRVQTCTPRGGRGDSTTEQREGAPLRVPPLFWKLGKTRVDWWTRERNAWVVDHPPNFWRAVQQDRLEFKSVRRSLYVCVVHLMWNTRRMYSIGKNVDWSYSKQLEACSCTFSSN